MSRYKKKLEKKNCTFFFDCDHLKPHFQWMTCNPNNHMEKNIFSLFCFVLFSFFFLFLLFGCRTYKTQQMNCYLNENMFFRHLFYCCCEQRVWIWLHSQYLSMVIMIHGYIKSIWMCPFPFYLLFFFSFSLLNLCTRFLVNFIKKKKKNTLIGR